MADDTIRLKLQVEGQEQAQTLKNRIEALKAELRDLQTGYQSGYFGKEALGPINDLTKQIQQAEKQQAKLASTTRVMETAAGTGKGGFQNLGMSVLFVSQAVEDLQYGFSAIVNNIPMIAMSLGAGAGVAGAASLAAVAVNQLSKHMGELAGSKGIVTQAEYMERLAKATALSADEAKRLSGMQATVEGGKGVLKQEATLTPQGKETSAAVKEVTDRIGGNTLADQLARSRTQTDEQLKGFLGEVKDWNGLTEKQRFQNLLNARTQQGGQLSEEQTVEFNRLAKIANTNADTKASQDIADLQNGSADERKAKAQQIAGDLQRINPDVANELKAAADPNRVLREQAGQADIAYKEQEVSRSEPVASQLMTRPNDQAQQEQVRANLTGVGIRDETINEVIKRQNATLKERQTILEAQLKSQGYTADQIAVIVEKEQRTAKEREDEAAAASRHRDAQATRDLVHDQAMDTAKKVMGPGGTFSDSAQTEILKSAGQNTDMASVVMTELIQDEEKRIELLKEEMRAQGASNEQINERIRLEKEGKFAEQKQERQIGKTGFTVEGVGNDILALTRSREQGGMGLSREDAEKFEKQQLTDSMMMQGFSQSEAGKMSETLISKGADQVTEAMEDLARTMPDSIQGMKDLMREQMAAAERLERNGIKMVLGRR